MKYLIGLHDSYFIITPYSALHFLLGWLIQRYSDHAAVPVVVFGGWAVFEYWASPAFGYWTSRNTANTAADIAIGAIAYRGTFTPHYVALLGLCLGGLLKKYPGKEDEFDSLTNTDEPHVVLEVMRKWRHKCSSGLEASTLWEARKEQRRTSDMAIFPSGVKHLFFPKVLDPYQKPTPAHKALAGAYLLMCALPGDAPNLLANLCIPFALTNPSRARILAQDSRIDTAVTEADSELEGHKRAVG